MIGTLKGCSTANAPDGYRLTSSALRCVGFCFYMQPKLLKTLECSLETVSKSYQEIEKDDIAYVSMTNGVSVLSGRMEMHMKSKSSITTEEAIDSDRYSPIHPGEILLEEFLKSLGISQYRLAKDIGVPPRRINEIVHGQRAITADTALRLARYFGTSDRFWLNLQTHYDLEKEKERLGGRLDHEVTILTRAEPGS